jgi:hypothetical protein
MSIIDTVRTLGTIGAIDSEREASKRALAVARADLDESYRAHAAFVADIIVALGGPAAIPRDNPRAVTEQDIIRAIESRRP